MEALLRIPRVVTHAEAYAEVEKSQPDEVLYDRVIKVYVAALTAIEGTARWLVQHPMSE